MPERFVNLRALFFDSHNSLDNKSQRHMDEPNSLRDKGK